MEQETLEMLFPHSYKEAKEGEGETIENLFPDGDKD